MGSNSWLVLSLLVLHNFGWEDGEMRGEFPLSGMCDEEPVVGVERRGVWASCNLGLGIDFMTLYFMDLLYSPLARRFSVL